MEDCPTCRRRCIPTERRSEVGDSILLEEVHEYCGYIFSFRFYPKGVVATPPIKGTEEDGDE